jgi:hypothetical protein
VWQFGFLYCKMNNFVSYLSVSSSVFTLLAISNDRRKVIVRPIAPKPGRLLILLSILSIWLISSILAFPAPNLTFLKQQWQMVGKTRKVSGFLFLQYCSFILFYFTDCEDVCCCCLRVHDLLGTLPYLLHPCIPQSLHHQDSLHQPYLPLLLLACCHNPTNNPKQLKTTVVGVVLLSIRKNHHHHTTRRVSLQLEQF